MYGRKILTAVAIGVTVMLSGAHGYASSSQSDSAHQAQLRHWAQEKADKQRRESEAGKRRQDETRKSDLAHQAQLQRWAQEKTDKQRRESDASKQRRAEHERIRAAHLAQMQANERLAEAKQAERRKSYYRHH